MGLVPTLATFRTAITDVIKEALSPGTPANVDKVVHKFRRFWRDEQKFRALFLRTDTGVPVDFNGKINGWMITRVRTVPEEAEERFRFYGLHEWELHGYLGIEDETVTTEEAFQDQIELIRDDFRLSRPVFGNMERVLPDVAVDSVMPVTIGNTTAWFAKLRLRTEGIEVKTENP